MSQVNNSRISNIDLAPQGHLAIDWARRHSPLVDGFLRERLNDGALAGRRVAVVVHLEAKTAFLATVLADAAAEAVEANVRDEMFPIFQQMGHCSEMYV